MSQRGAFAEFLIEYLESGGDGDGADDEDLGDIKKEVEQALGKEEYKRQLLRVKSHESNRYIT